MARKNLKEARKRAGMTQQQMADRLEIGLRHYKYIESGEVVGNIQIWDELEDITGIHQRKLREISETHPGKEDNQQKH
ncbi:helix-turn-helix transcriptional regulator [Hungatella hathewayi]|nr:helix-turn-helix transcriptional regulator [Hungatella hathewayi]